MFPTLIKSIYLKLATSRTALCQAGTWTVVLFLTVAVASFSPEFAFVRAISPSSEYSKRCGHGHVRIPMEVPGDMLCFPIDMVRRSDFDLFIPSVFAGLTVAGSVVFLRAFNMWQN